MADNLRIGAEVGRTNDHHLRGVIVDSHPTEGWLVWWCGPCVASWEEAGGLWLRVGDRPRLLPAVVLIDDDGDRTTVSRDYCPQDDDALGVRIHAPACDVDWWLSDDEAADLIAALQRVVEAP